MIVTLRRIHAPALITASLMAACGGNVVVDPAGAGGAGGAPTTSSSLTTTGSTTSGPTTSSGTSGCDNQGFCGDSTSGCVGCSLAGNCADELELCTSDVDCTNYTICITPCSEQACVDQCALAYPGGAELYNQIVFCVICEECYYDCDGPGAGCP